MFHDAGSSQRAFPGLGARPPHRLAEKPPNIVEIPLTTALLVPEADRTTNPLQAENKLRYGKQVKRYVVSLRLAWVHGLATKPPLTDPGSEVEDPLCRPLLSTLRSGRGASEPGEGPQGFVDRPRVRKDSCDVGVQKHHIGTLRIPGGSAASCRLGEVVLGPHSVFVLTMLLVATVFRMRHGSS